MEAGASVRPSATFQPSGFRRGRWEPSRLFWFLVENLFLVPARRDLEPGVLQVASESGNSQVCGFLQFLFAWFSVLLTFLNS